MDEDIKPGTYMVYYSFHTHNMIAEAMERAVKSLRYSASSRQAEDNMRTCLQLLSRALVLARDAESGERKAKFSDE